MRDREDRSSGRYRPWHEGNSNVPSATPPPIPHLGPIKKSYSTKPFKRHNQTTGRVHPPSCPQTNNSGYFVRSFSNSARHKFTNNTTPHRFGSISIGSKVLREPSVPLTISCASSSHTSPPSPDISSMAAQSPMAVDLAPSCSTTSSTLSKGHLVHSPSASPLTPELTVTPTPFRSVINQLR